MLPVEALKAIAGFGGCINGLSSTWDAYDTVATLIKGSRVRLVSLIFFKLDFLVGFRWKIVKMFING